MATQYLTKNDQSNTSKGLPVWEGSQTLTSGTIGSSLLVPDESGIIENITISLVISSGSGKVQTTASSRAAVKAGTANWVDWDRGVVSATTTDVFFDVTAIRAVRSAGTIILEVRAT